MLAVVVLFSRLSQNPNLASHLPLFFFLLNLFPPPAVHPADPSYPLPADNEAIAPDLLERAAEAGMDPKMFGDDVMSFMTGGVSAEEMVARRKAKLADKGLAGLGVKE